LRYAVALPLSAEISSAQGEAPVWSDPRGKARGEGLSPLHREVPEVALPDPALYELLALLDALRVWSAAAIAHWRGGYCRNV